MYGVNQDTVSVEDIDRYKLSEQDKIAHLKDISAFPGVQEVCIMSSDVRSEYYLNVDEKNFKHGDLLRYLSEYADKPLKEIILETYSKFNKDVINHLFSILSGMESKARGSFATLKYAEAALETANDEAVSGQVLRELFKNAIDFSRKMRLSSTMRPIYLTEPARAIEVLKDKAGELVDKKLVLFGTDYDMLHLSKMLLELDIESLTIVDENSMNSNHMVTMLKDWIYLTKSEHNEVRLHAADLSSMNYRLSNADGVVISSNFDSELLTEDLMLNVKKMRQTKKRQLIVDFTEKKQSAFSVLGSLVSYEAPSMHHSKDFSEEEVASAELFFEEHMNQATDRFMENYKQATEVTSDKKRNLSRFNLAVGSDHTFGHLST